MRKSILFAGAAVVSLMTALPVFGGNKHFTAPPHGWELVARSGDGVSHFINSASVNKQNDLVEVWQMVNYSRPGKNKDGKIYWSSKKFTLIDCKRKTSALKEATTYAGANGQGNVIDIFKWKVLEYDLVVPDTVAESLLKAVCNKSENTAEFTR